MKSIIWHDHTVWRTYLFSVWSNCQYDHNMWVLYAGLYGAQISTGLLIYKLADQIKVLLLQFKVCYFLVRSNKGYQNIYHISWIFCWQHLDMMEWCI